MSIPIEIKNGRLYDYDVPRIKSDEQEELLKKYYVHEHSREAINNWVLFEDPETGKIYEEKVNQFISTEVIGFCIRTECKKKSVHTKAVRAVSTFYCMKHLSDSVYLSRAMSYAGPILIQFTSRVLGTKTIHQEYFGLENYLHFDNSSMLIGKGYPITGRFIETNSTVDDTVIQFTFMVDSNVKINGEHYNGTIISTLRGRHVCQNIVDNKPCLSRDAEEITESVPKGVPNWKELLVEGKDHAKIITLKKCYQCAISEVNSERYKTNSPYGKSPARLGYEEKIDLLQKEIAELRKTVYDMQKTLRELTSGKKPYKGKPKKNRDFFD